MLGSVGAHIYHALHFLTHEWKAGGILAVVGMVAGFFLIGSSMTTPADCQMLATGEYCFGTAIDPEGLLSHLGGAVVGGLVGTGLALLLASLLGVSKDTLGIDE